MSTLVIEKAQMAHAGKFTCAPSYAKPDTVTVHVVDGELQKAGCVLQKKMKGAGAMNKDNNITSIFFLGPWPWRTFGPT